MAQQFNIPFGTQLAFLYDELLGNEKKTLDAFKSGNFSTPTEYAVAFENLYERAGGSNIGRRTAFADEVFKELNKEKPDLPERVLEAARFFGGKGFDNAQTAGIIGNLMTESYKTLMPDAFNEKGGGQGAYGIAQWRGSRLKDLVNFSKNYPNTAPPLNEMKTLGPVVRGTTSENTTGVNSMASLMDILMGNARRPTEETGSTLTGTQRFFGQRDPATGLTPFQGLAAGMDRLILRGYGQGQAIREQGLRQAQADKTNLTAEWFASQPNGALFAEMMKMGVPVAQVYAAYVKMQQGDAVTVGKYLVDRKTGDVLFDGSKGSGSGMGGVEILPDGTIKITKGAVPDVDLNQSQAMLYGQRMKDANKLLALYEKSGTDFFQNALQLVPWGLGRTMQSDDFKDFDDARRDFVNAVLRRESGAAIADSEFESARRQYFPVIGDGPRQIEEKRKRGERATELLILASGPEGAAYLKLLEAEQKQVNPLYGTEAYIQEQIELGNEDYLPTSDLIPSSSSTSNTTPQGNERITFPSS